VLVVEDDASLRLLCRLNLELDGFRVAEADAVEAARAAVAAERPALVVLDLTLGTEDAAPLLDELRAGGLPVLVLTGAADAGRHRDRASALLPKPFDPAALVDVVRSLTAANLPSP
jgi:DNA-binding response OmpR family regulator